MPRKTKETVEEKNIEKTVKTKETKKSVKEKSPAKKATKSSSQSQEAKKAVKKTSTKKETSSKKTTTKKITSKKASTAEKKAVAKKATTSKKISTKKAASPAIVEYYDLEHNYNKTIVKVLYQDPTTLFVYWEISSADIENYKKQYGENFFETTRPVLVVYNDTLNYHFEISINDFANCWYFNITDPKCDYRVELIRKPISYNENINTDIHISSSNKLESPNDKILFSTDEIDTVYFKNTSDDSLRKVNLPELLEQLNLYNKNHGFPIIRHVSDLYKSVYHLDNSGASSEDLLKNPSSNSNPSSHSLPIRFI